MQATTVTRPSLPRPRSAPPAPHPRPRRARAAGRWGAAAAAVWLVVVGGTGVAAAAASLPQVPGALAAGAACTRVGAKADVPSVPWSQASLGLAAASRYSSGQGVVVAVLDTGVDAAAPALKGRVLRGVDTTSGHAGGRADSDCVGHGTFTAGLVAAAPLPGTGFAGVAPQARVLPVRVAGRAGTATPAALAAGVTAAVAGGARVVDVGVSATHGSPALTAAVAAAQRAGVLVVAGDAVDPLPGAASTDPDTTPPTPYPAALPGVLAVGATPPPGSELAVPQAGARPALTAPGAALVGLGPGTGAGHLYGTGTAFAAALTAGTAALLLADHPAWTAAQATRQLESTAYHSPGPLPAPATGWGALDPAAALTTVVPTAPPAAPAPAVLTVPRRPADAAPREAVEVASAAAVLTAALATARALRRRASDRAAADV